MFVATRVHVTSCLAPGARDTCNFRRVAHAHLQTTLCLVFWRIFWVTAFPEHHHMALCCRRLFACQCTAPAQNPALLLQGCFNEQRLVPNEEQAHKVFQSGLMVSDRFPRGRNGVDARPPSKTASPTVDAHCLSSKSDRGTPSNDASRRRCGLSGSAPESNVVLARGNLLRATRRNVRKKLKRNAVGLCEAVPKTSDALFDVPERGHKDHGEKSGQCDRRERHAP